ncbi:MAG: helix-turn-helix transcriptional regulator [Xanthobacteraceae bacterium]|nr:helix-turn-helix transcriptional regulator [Xanthobacteraceae bacterium]
MDETETVSALVGDIYDAALDAALWPAVLGNASRFVGGLASALYSKDASAKTGVVYYDDGGIDPHYRQLYFEHYVKLDPSTTAQFFAEIGQLISTVDFMPRDEFTETRFYREWVRPQGIVDSLNAALDKSATSVASFIVFRHERDGLVDDEMRRRMRLIAPHVRRSVLIGRVIDLKTMEAATFADTLDGLAAGMFLVDANARIVHANASGHAMLETGEVLRSAGDRLTAGDAAADQALRTVFAASGSGDAAVGVKGIAVPLAARGGEPYVAHVLPLTSGARRQASRSYAAAAALFVHKAALATPTPPEVIAKTYNLTPTELRVLLAVVQVGGVPEVAEALGIAESTVRSHLQQLFEKTGAHRQADLVKLVAAFINPLID